MHRASSVRITEEERMFLRKVQYLWLSILTKKVGKNDGFLLIPFLKFGMLKKRIYPLALFLFLERYQRCLMTFLFLVAPSMDGISERIALLLLARSYLILRLVFIFDFFP